MHGTRVSPERGRWNLAPDAMLWEVGSWQGLGREGASLMRRSGVLISDRDPRQLLHPLLPGETHRGCDGRLWTGQGPSPDPEPSPWTPRPAECRKGTFVTYAAQPAVFSYGSSDGLKRIPKPRHLLCHVLSRHRNLFVRSPRQPLTLCPDRGGRCRFLGVAHGGRAVVPLRSLELSPGPTSGVPGACRSPAAEGGVWGPDR